MKNAVEEKIRISAVSYLNTLPFVYGLKNITLGFSTDLSLDTPAECARKLIHNEADLGLVPVASIPGINNAEIVSDFCIGAIGKVQTVLLLSNYPLKEIKTIFLDTDSRTSVKLLKILGKRFWKRDFEWRTMDISNYRGNRPVGFLMIGDKTFAERKKFKYGIDLSLEWERFTGLPFVFAAWVANKHLPADFVNNFNRALRYGIANIDRASEGYENGLIGHEDLKDYLKHSISYSLDAKKKQAMTLFLQYAASL
jgi:chorismate dehydratase